LRQLPDLTI